LGLVAQKLDLEAVGEGFVLEAGFGEQFGETFLGKLGGELGGGGHGKGEGGIKPACRLDFPSMRLRRQWQNGKPETSMYLGGCGERSACFRTRRAQGVDDALGGCQGWRMGGKADNERQSAARCERWGVELTEREQTGGWPICDARYAVRGSCWPEFCRKYYAWLREDEAAQAALERLRQRLAKGPVALLFAARDRERNNAVALKRLLEAGG